MRRGIRFLALAGIPLLLFGILFLVFLVDFACWEGCPDADLGPAITDRLAGGLPLLLLSAIPVALGWILCLVQLVRIGRRGVAVALALTLPLACSLSLLLFYASTGGTWVPTSWAARYTGWGWGWDVSLGRSLALLLLWPVATFAATFALKGRQTAE
jgi:hypothetical protein